MRMLSTWRDDEMRRLFQSLQLRRKGGKGAPPARRIPPPHKELSGARLGIPLLPQHKEAAVSTGFGLPNRCLFQIAECVLAHFKEAVSPRGKWVNQCRRALARCNESASGYWQSRKWQTPVPENTSNTLVAKPDGAPFRR
jgi:hypothetical protein